MREFELLTSILHDDFLCKGEEENVLIENQGCEHQEQRIYIVNKVRSISRMSLYRFDEKTSGKDFLPFFNNHNHAPVDLRSFCDYILLVECNGRLYIMLIELKRGSKTGYTKQIEGSLCFMEYVVSSAVRIQHYNNFDDFDKGNIEFRRIVIQQCDSIKEKTHPNEFDNVKNSYIRIRYFSDFRPVQVIF